MRWPAGFGGALLDPGERSNIEDWLSQRATRSEAQTALLWPGVPPGAYCLRKSSDATAVAVLCVRLENERVGHFRLLRGASGGVVLIDVPTTGGDRDYADIFACIADLKRPGRGAEVVGIDIAFCVGSDAAV